MNRKGVFCIAMAVLMLLGACQTSTEIPAATPGVTDEESTYSEEMTASEATSDPVPTELPDPSGEEATATYDSLMEQLDYSTIGSDAMPASNVALFKPGVPAPDFAAQNRDGTTVSLADYAGRTLILNFWASWCGPCQMEMPDLNALDQEWMRGGPVELLTVNATDGATETVQSATDFLDEFSYGFHVIFDTTLAIGTVYEATSIPTTFFIKPDGTLYAVIVGATERSVIEKLLEGMA